jgi:hypothetical protein
MDGDAQSSAKGPHVVFWLWIGLGVLVLIVVSVILWKGGFFSPATEKFFHVVYVSPQQDGTLNWYQDEKGSLQSHPAPAPGMIAGLAFGGNAVYMSIDTFIPDRKSGVYSYKDGAYATLYSDPTHAIQRISVSPDGTFVGLTGMGESGKSTAVLEARNGIITELGDGTLPPQFLSGNSINAVLYTSGSTLYARIFQGGSWQKPVVVYQGAGATMSAYVADGGKQFSFIDPSQGNLQEWEVTSFNPFAVTPKVIQDPMPGMSLGYGAGTLFGYQFSGPTNVPYHDIDITNVATGVKYSLSAPDSIGPSGGVFPLSLPSL